MQPVDNRWLFVPVSLAVVGLLASLWSALGPDPRPERANLAQDSEEASPSDAPAVTPAAPARTAKR